MAGDNIDRIKERVDIVDLIGGRVQLRRAGRNMKGLCPFHQEKTPSFVVFPDSQHYHCFGCGKSGDIFTFVMETENLDFRDAMERLAQRAGVELARTGAPKKDERREFLIELNEMAASFFARSLWSGDRGAEARAVLERRGVDRETADTFTLGYAPDSWDALKKHLQQQANASEDQLIEAGLLSKNDSGRTYDRFRNRLMFPIRRRDGKAIGFGARALGDDMPKYLNSPQTPIFNKSAVLYGLNDAYAEVRATRSLIVVEGYMDAITAHQFGYANTVASMGTALTQDQVHSIRRYVDRVFIALDADAAGNLATLRAVDTVRDAFGEDSSAPVVDSRSVIRFERALSAEIRIVLMEAGTDPDELIRTNRPAWDEALENAMPLVEYVIRQRLAGVEDSPTARAAALHEFIVPVLREIPDHAVQAEYVDLAARLLGYPEREVLSAVRAVGSAQRRRSHMQALERPSAADPEETLTRLLLTLPIGFAARQGTLYQIRPEMIRNSRNRQIIDAILLHEGDRDAALEELDEDLQAFAERVIEGTIHRGDISPGMANIEISQAIEALERTRYAQDVAQVRADIDEAKSSGDTELLRASMERMSRLAALKPQHAPRESPYFRDSRTVER